MRRSGGERADGSVAHRPDPVPAAEPCIDYPGYTCICTPSIPVRDPVQTVSPRRRRLAVLKYRFILHFVWSPFYQISL